MSDGDPPLRLLSLPNTPRRNIIQCMEHIDQFALSLVSNRSKELVKSIDIKCHAINIKVNIIISIRIQFPRDTIECSFDDYQRSVDNPSPNNIKSKVSLGNEGGFVHNKPEYRFEEWLNHALELYHQSELDRVSIFTPLPDMKSFRKTFNKVPTLFILGADDEPKIIEYYRCLRPEKNLIFTVGEFFVHRNENSELLHEIFLHNLDFIYIALMGQLTLDDLLIMNSQKIEIFCQLAINYESIVNRFIKHWLAGSNPRLRYIELECMKCRLPRAEAILNGIKHEIVSEKDPKTLNAFKTSGIGKLKFRGGYNIRRRDGTVATVSFNERNSFVMYIWS
ncbi:hypothetical protein CRE_31456 [Caenorhabditis remanei]|uniref:F-box domain-containing protein n=1 Tax=Caenorhabditis remanei TaxID=31234 RepID=E3NAC8_CAERE|nr:hypothetical protein CRE_31456 [Caenorhabditis remanei]